MTLAPLAGAALPPGAGRKAEHLAWLHRHGAAVPTGWVLPAGVDPVEVRAALAAVVDPAAAYAVRSSADVEDGSGHTFAGQYRSLLDVRGLDALVDAVAAVRASSREAGASRYAAAAGIDPGAVRMGVVVQRMVEPVVSGVAFSRNPLTGLDEVVVEAIPGRGDALVQDGATPDRWIHRWGALTERPAAPRTHEELVEEVARGTRRIAEAFGRPVDLEWVWDGASLWWVQVRPITGLEGIGIYSNRIAREVLPGIIPPLVWSVNVPVVNRAWVALFTEAIGPNRIDPDRLARPFAFRAYFDMGAIGEIFVALGMPRDALELLLGLPAGPERPRFRPTRATYRHLPRMLLLALRLLRYDRRVTRELPALRARYDALGATEPAALGEPALLARIDALMAVTTEMAYANIVTPLLMNGYGAIVRRRVAALGVDPARVDPARDLPGIHDRDPRHALAELGALAAALPPAERARLAADPDAVLAPAAAGPAASAPGGPELAALRAGIGRFLERFGHLSDSGNDCSVATWRERPATVVALVLAAAGPDGGPRSITAPALPATDGPASLAWPDVRPLTRPGPARLLLGWLFGRAATFRRLREEVSFEYTRGYGRFRPTLLAFGDRLVARGALRARDDVFLLSLAELRDAAHGGDAAIRARVEARRAELAAAEELDLPETIVGDDFVPRRRAGGARELRGVPTSRGTYRGPARPIRSVAEGDRLRHGDVLVVPHSDVAWTPLFARAGAVVAESGGMLSHSSIVAREHGIPCVVSVAGALALPDGAEVHVDGYGGVVTVEVAGAAPTPPPAARQEG